MQLGPLYLPTRAPAPLGYTIRDSGVGAGPIFAFVITAASLSMPEFVLLSRPFLWRLIAGLITTIAVVGAFVVPLVVTG